MGSRENQYKQSLIPRLRELFPGSIILDGNANYLQGIPDVVILWRDTWAALEVKKSRGAKEQPNQRYYVDLMDAMSFSAFIDPENEESVLRDLQRSFETRRPTRISQRQRVSLDKLRRKQAS